MRWLGGAGVVVLTVAVALLLRSGEGAGPEPTLPPEAPTIAATLTDPAHW